MGLCRSVYGQRSRASRRMATGGTWRRSEAAPVARWPVDGARAALNRCDEREGFATKKASATGRAVKVHKESSLATLRGVGTYYPARSRNYLASNARVLVLGERSLRGEWGRSRRAPTDSGRTGRVHAELVRVAEGSAVATRLVCLLYTSPSPRDGLLSRMPSSA